MSVLYLQGAQDLTSPACIARQVKNATKPISGLMLTSLDVSSHSLVLRIDQLQTLLDLLASLKIQHLQCQNVNFTAINSGGGGNVALKACSELKTIEMLDCHDYVRFIVKAVRDCPLLESVNTRAKNPQYPASLDAQCRLIASNAAKNYRLRHFSMCEIAESIKEIQQSYKQRPAAPTREHEVFMSKDIIRYRDFIGKIIVRNDEGHQKCKQAIYTVFLIKRYGKSEMFACLNHDVVKLIVKLIYASRFDQLWFQQLDKLV